MLRKIIVGFGWVGTALTFLAVAAERLVLVRGRRLRLCIALPASPLARGVQDL